MFAVTMIGVLFAIYRSYNTPQTKLDKDVAVADAISEKELSTKATVLQQKEADNKAELLAKQVEWEKAANTTKFADMTLRIDQAFAIAQNHINTIETEVKVQTAMINSMGNKLTELSTILNERLPMKR